ncbi:MAG: aspartate kinase [Parachlamydiales bacterium]|nr:aspartate kinase [Parachlamydiales bacterium]
MKILVMKFGGDSLSTPKKILHAADIIIYRQKKYSAIVVVVSAMGEMTDELLNLAGKIHPQPPKREKDMLFTAGERISMSLLAMALHAKGKEAISFTGSQAGIITSSDHQDGKIIDVRPIRLLSHLEEGRIVIIAGFQGVSREKEVTTLGRGGSDTSAVALAVALQAEKVEFFKDVLGIYSEDPKKNTQAVFFKKLSYEEALKVIDAGAQVLHRRSIVLAQKNSLPMHVRSYRNFFKEAEKEFCGTMIGETCSQERPPILFEEIV